MAELFHVIYDDERNLSKHLKKNQIEKKSTLNSKLNGSDQ